MRHCQQRRGVSLLTGTAPSSRSSHSPLPLHQASMSFLSHNTISPKQTQADRIPSAKRYERMMKANGIHQSQSGPTTPPSIRDTPTPSSRRKNSPSAAPSTSGSGNKKRKLDDYAETTSGLNTDDDEGLFNVKAESSTTVKAEPVKAEHVESGKVKAEVIKEESTAQEGTDDSTACADEFVYPSSGGMGFDRADDSTLFDDFLAFGGSVPSIGMTPATGNGNENGVPESIVIAD